MSQNPLLTRPGMMERNKHLIHLCLRNDPQVFGYQFWGQRSVDGAYGDPVDSGVGGAGPAAMFQVQRGDCFRSPSLRRSGRGQIIGSTKGQTHLAFDPDDFLAPGVPLPPDNHWLFLRVQENRAPGLLALAGVPEATVTLNTVLAGDQLVIKGIFFEFAAGVNDLVGKAGNGGDPFIVGLGADDNAAAANLTLALNDNGDVAPAMDAVALLNTHTFATNVGAPSRVVLIQPEDAGAVLVAGDPVKFTITSSDPVTVTLDGAALAQGTLVWTADPTKPVLGPIYGIPTPNHFGTSGPSFTLQGTAPSGTGSVAGGLPQLSEDTGNVVPRTMHLVFPNNLAEVGITNISGNILLVSFGYNQAMQSVPAGRLLSLTRGQATIREVLLACPDVGGAAFTMRAVAATEKPV